MIRMVAAGQIGGGADGIILLRANRSHEVLGGRLIHKGGIDAHRESPVGTFDPCVIRCDRKNPGSILLLAKLIGNSLGVCAIRIGHVGGRNAIAKVLIGVQKQDRTIFLQNRRKVQKAQPESKGIAGQRFFDDNGFLHIVAIQLILQVHTGEYVFIEHLGAEAGRGDLLGERRLLIAGISLEEILHCGKQRGKTGGRRFFPIRVGNLRGGRPVVRLHGAFRNRFRRFHGNRFRGGFRLCFRDSFRFRFGKRLRLCFRGRLHNGLRILRFHRMCFFLRLGNRIFLDSSHGQRERRFCVICRIHRQLRGSLGLCSL